jgi:putative transposase
LDDGRFEAPPLLRSLIGQANCSSAGVSPNRLPRIEGFSYCGPYRYFFTNCVSKARPVFRNLGEGQSVIDQLLLTSARFEFAVLAYCVMPDHVHALVDGLSASADFRGFMRLWKQHTGYGWKQRHGKRLWQPGYHEYVLHSDDLSASFVEYILQNPVRAGLVSAADDYPLSGPHPGVSG